MPALGRKSSPTRNPTPRSRRPWTPRSTTVAPAFRCTARRRDSPSDIPAQPTSPARRTTQDPRAAWKTTLLSGKARKVTRPSKAARWATLTTRPSKAARWVTLTSKATRETIQASKAARATILASKAARDTDSLPWAPQVVGLASREVARQGQEAGAAARAGVPTGAGPVEARAARVDAIPEAVNRTAHSMRQRRRSSYRMSGNASHLYIGETLRSVSPVRKVQAPYPGPRSRRQTSALWVKCQGWRHSGVVPGGYTWRSGAASRAFSSPPGV